MKFLPFDEDDLKKLDLLIRRDDHLRRTKSDWRVKKDPARWAETLRERARDVRTRP